MIGPIAAVPFQLLLLAGIAPVFEGWIARCAAWCGRRHSAPVWQPALDIRKWLRKEPLVVGGVAPRPAALALLAALAAGLLIPTWSREAPIGSGDALVALLLLSAARAIARPPGGLAVTGILTEPLVVCALLGSFINAHSTALARLAGAGPPLPVAALTAVALAAILCADDAVTRPADEHLAPGTDAPSGPERAFTRWALAIRRQALVSAGLGALTPLGAPEQLDWIAAAFAGTLLYLAWMLAAGALLGAVRATAGRLGLGVWGLFMLGTALAALSAMA